MSKSIRIDGNLVQDAEIVAKATNRTTPRQIEHWAHIGRIAEDNPDLPYGFIRDALIATEEVKAGKVTRYARRRPKG